jgi:3-dehydroquinate dehydratase
LRTKAERAGRLGADLFKVATITDSGEQLRRLTDFIRTCDTDVPLAVMGMGKLALESRVLLSAAGSIFAYASVGRPRVAGQPSLPQLRSALARAPKRLT